MVKRMPSRQELLDSIRPEMKLTKEFFKRIYGYAYTTPEFAEEALSKLEAAGCSRAREYYQNYIQEYEAWYDEQVKPAAKWIREQIDKDFERKVKGSRKQQEVEPIKENSQKWMDGMY